MANTLNFIFGLLAIVAQLAVIWLLLSWLFGWKSPEFARSHALLLAFATALIATLGSLTYSEILGYEPCKLCWIQRIFMYPQALILGLAIWGKHKGVNALLDVSLVLSVIGALVAADHYLMQLGIVPEGSCAAVGYVLAESSSALATSPFR